LRFVAYRPRKQSNPKNNSIGVVIGDAMVPLTSIDEFYADIDKWVATAKTMTSGTLPVSELILAPPVPVDAKVICAAINYVKHGAEASLPTPAFPNLFARWASELVVDGTPIPVPAAEPDGLDWEVELAAIVGQKVTDADEATAAASVFGYTVANDISGRASQGKAMTLSTGQWALAKNVEKSGAVGSFIESADTVDVRNLRLKTVVDGNIMQSDSTADMIFSVGDLISYSSRHVTLRPGDLILTGTPEGVGFGRKPKVYMKPGATVTVSVEGVCSITNPIVDSSHRGWQHQYEEKSRWLRG
jgi:2-keto-4-pentenoate hydratase/2-oxohepta-3-ene-1,7-dioic acid hydratase in catechol pathway